MAIHIPDRQTSPLELRAEIGNMIETDVWFQSRRVFLHRTGNAEADRLAAEQFEQRVMEWILNA